VEMYAKYKSPFGYSSGDNQIDSYGVDHSGFSLRDELEYQTARQAREHVLKQNFARQGKNKDYPQYGAGFWGRPENNYGFGSSDIGQNIEERPFTPFPAALGGKEQPALRKEAASLSINGNNLNANDRIEALRTGKKIFINVAENKDANNEWPWDHSPTLGDFYVDKYKALIEKYSKQYNLDPDIAKAILYSEAADYHRFGLDHLADCIRVSGSVRPMNIQGKTWGDFQGKHYDVYNPEQNIELGIKVLKSLYDAVPDKDIAKIATLWNGTGLKRINDYGLRARDYYHNKYWDTKQMKPQLESK